jgi:catechol 2,3-dioxygenase
MPTIRDEVPFTVAPEGYRIPAAVELGLVRLQVADLTRSARYYERVLGLRPVGSASSRLLLGPPGGEAALIELNELPGARPVPRRGRLGLYHYALLVPDRAYLGRLLKHLKTQGEYAGMADHLVSEALYLTDPDGLGIEVYADRPREGWRVQGATLAMASDPLDVDGLIRAGGNEAWAGLPPGTSMGHVHLYVGDLEAAAALYHRALGFDRIVLDFPGALFMSAGGYHHHLGTNVWAAGAPPAGENDARLLEWTLRLPEQSDVDEAARSLTGSGYAVGRAGADVLATDPWGTTLRLTADSHSSPRDFQ